MPVVAGVPGVPRLREDVVDGRCPTNRRDERVVGRGQDVREHLVRCVGGGPEVEPDEDEEVGRGAAWMEPVLERPDDRGGDSRLRRSLDQLRDGDGPAGERRHQQRGGTDGQPRLMVDHDRHVLGGRRREGSGPGGLELTPEPSDEGVDACQGRAGPPDGAPDQRPRGERVVHGHADTVPPRDLAVTAFDSAPAFKPRAWAAPPG